MLPASRPTPPVTATFDQGSFPCSPPLPTGLQEHVPLRVHRLRRIQDARAVRPCSPSIKRLRAPTVFDAPRGLLLPGDPKVLRFRTWCGTTNAYCVCCRLDWSTRTPAPMVLDSEIFRR